MSKKYPVTPDGRYFVVRDRLWRRSNPGLPEERRAALVDRLMKARRSLRRDAPIEGRAFARAEVDAVKCELGERGTVWWADGTPDLNRKLVRNTAYAAWYQGLTREPI